jgi:hypothetical protein
MVVLISLKETSMKLLILAVTVFCFFQVNAQTPRVFVLDAKSLRENKARLVNKDDALQPAYKQLLQEADKALPQGPFSVMEKKNVPPSGNKHDYMSLAPYFWPDSSKPGGVPYLRKDGQTNPEVKDYKDKEYMPKLSELVQTLGLAYYFSGNEAYAQHASELLKVWFLNPGSKMNPNLNYAQAIKGVNDGRGSGIIDSRHLIKIVDAVGLLNGSKYWKKEQEAGMKNWYKQFLNWLQTSKNGRDEMKAANNHGTWYDAQRLAFALFIDSLDLAKKIVTSAQNRLDNQMDDEGKFPREMERTIALHYNVFDLDAFFLIAAMAEKVNMDLWHYTSPSGKSLKKGFDFLYPYVSNQKKWEGQQIKDFDFEEGYGIMAVASKKYGCQKCTEAINSLAGDKSKRFRLNLLK